jgi:hypothetical protein
MQETALAQRAYTATVEQFVKTGAGCAHYTEFAMTPGLRPEEAGRVERKAAGDPSMACFIFTRVSYNL